MKFIIFLLSIFTISFAVTIEDVKNWDQIGQYNRICKENVRNLFIEKQNESLANIYAKACLSMDKVNELVVPMVMLYKTPEARENASLYSTILFQKKMLYLSLVDGVDISYIRTPKINYVLSEIFDKFVMRDYTIIDGKFSFIMSNGTRSDLFIKDDEGVKKMVIVGYKDDKIDFIKMYW